MNISQNILDNVPEMTEWRHWLHQHPEVAFEEHETSAYIAEKLKSFGIEVHEGIAGTGVVGVIKGSSEGRAIGLRAELDALAMEEKTGVPHASLNAGKMHACGHDGHMAMLLGAAKLLAEKRDFAGTVYVIFQPAEENEGGAPRMIEEGVLEKFPMEAMFAMHNLPGLPEGALGFREGAFLAAYDVFTVTITGEGSHGAHPEQGTSPFSAVGAMVEAITGFTSPSDVVEQKRVASVTQIHGGDTWNVIPDQVVLKGTCRSFSKTVQDELEASFAAEAKRIGEAYDVEIEVDYERRYPPTVNSVEETQFAKSVAEDLGAEVLFPCEVSTGGEDFAFFLEKIPGSYLRIGAGEGVGLHNSQFDFNDQLLPIGVSYWVELVRGVFFR